MTSGPTAPELGGRPQPGAARLGVLGWPVAHSLSPAIQNAALRAAGLTGWRYQLLPAPPDLFAPIVRALPGAGFAGANVTIPHKQAALELADRASDRARAIGAANTLVFRGGAIAADNTDAPALVAALPFPPAGRTALVLGAGGSARAAIWALLDAGAAEVRVWNRTPARARELAAALGASPVELAAGGPAPPTAAADILVNCTSVGLDGSDPFDRLPLAPGDLAAYGCVADLVYTPSGTILVTRARELGVATVDGLELLVGQGALSFEHFTGRPAVLDAMRAALAAS